MAENLFRSRINALAPSRAGPNERKFFRRKITSPLVPRGRTPHL